VQIWERDPVVGAESSSFGDSWDAISVYGLNEVVTFNDLLYTSIVTNNQNNNPASAPEAWSQFDLVTRWNVNEIYQSRDPVIATDYNIYISLTSDNQGNDPTTSPSEWQATGTGSGAIPAFVDWDPTVNYSEGGANIVTASDENYYVSLVAGNFNNNPISSPSEWEQIDHITGGNIVIDGDTISSTATDSDIDLAPNGVGKLTYNGIEVADLNVTGLLAPIDSPTFTTLAVLPSNTTIGSVSSTEIGYLNGGTENIQGALNAAARTGDNETITGDWRYNNDVTYGNEDAILGRNQADSTSYNIAKISSSNEVALGDLSLPLKINSNGVIDIIPAGGRNLFGVIPTAIGKVDGATGNFLSNVGFSSSSRVSQGVYRVNISGGIPVDDMAVYVSCWGLSGLVYIDYKINSTTQIEFRCSVTTTGASVDCAEFTVSVTPLNLV